jgi:hypothetical protein
MKQFRLFFVKRDVFEAFSVFFKILNVFGMAAFKFKSKSFQSSILDILWFIFIESITIVNISIHYNFITTVSYSTVLSIASSVFFKVPLFLISFIPIAFFVKRKSFFEILMRIHKFDNKVNST